MGKTSRKKSSMAKKGNTKQKRLVNAFEVVNVTKSLIITDIFHFFYAGGKVCLLPFLTLFFRQLGLTATQAGIICAAKALMGLISIPLWSTCAMKCNVRRVTMMGSIFVTIAVYLALTLVPPVNQPGMESLMFCSAKPANHQNTGQGSLMSNNTVTLTLPILPSSVATTVTVSTAGTTAGAAQASVSPLNGSSPAIEGSTVTPASASPMIHTTSGAKVTSTSNGSTSTFLESNEAASSDSGSGSIKPGSTSSTLEPQPSSSSIAFASTTFSVPQWQSSTLNPTRGVELGERKPEPSGRIHLTRANMKKLIKQLGLTADDLSHMTNKELKEFLKSKLQELTEKASESRGSVFASDPERRGFSGQNDNDGVNPDQYSDRVFQDGTFHHALYKRDTNETTSKGILDKLKDLKEKITSSEYYSKYRTFMVVLFVLLLGEFLVAPMEKIADDAWYDYLENVDDVEKYGQQGFWALLSTDIFAVVIALIVDNTDCVLSLNINHFMIHFYLFAGLLTVSLLIGFCYPLTGKCKSKSRRGAVIKTVRLLCCDLRCFTFAISTLIMGIVRGSLYSFHFWQIQDLGGTEIVMGLTITVAACAEIPMFFMGGWLARKISSTALIGTALVLQAGQLVYLSFLWSPWAAIPIHVLSMFTSTGLWKALDTHPDFNTSHHTGVGRTVKAFLNVIYNCLGFAIGCGLSGWLYDLFSIAMLFRGEAVMCGAWFLLFLLLQKCVPKKERVEYIKLLNADDETFSDSSDNLYEDDWLKNAMKEA